MPAGTCMTASGAYKVIQREERQQCLHHLGAAVAVAAHALLADGRAGEVRVGQNELVAVPHFGDDLSSSGLMIGEIPFSIKKPPFICGGLSS